MKIFVPAKLLCKVGLHDWTYGFDTETKKFSKKCIRCGIEKNVDPNEAKKKAKSLYEIYEATKDR